jgi:hypothetical protein
MNGICIPHWKFSLETAEMLSSINNKLVQVIQQEWKQVLHGR